MRRAASSRRASGLDRHPYDEVTFPDRAGVALPLGSIGGRARVAEWQTRRTQNPLFARTCGFESHLGHWSSAAPLSVRITSSVRDASLSDALGTEAPIGTDWHRSSVGRR